MSYMIVNRTGKPVRELPMGDAASAMAPTHLVKTALFAGVAFAGAKLLWRTSTSTAVLMAVLSGALDFAVEYMTPPRPLKEIP